MHTIGLDRRRRRGRQAAARSGKGVEMGQVTQGNRIWLGTRQQCSIVTC